MMRSFEKSCRRYFPRGGTRHGLDAIDAVMESIIKVIESDKITRWLAGEDEIRSIEGYLIKAMLTEQSRVAMGYIRKDRVEGRLAPSFYETCIADDAEIFLIISQLKEHLDDQEAQVVWGIENNVSLETMLSLMGITKYRYYQIRSAIVEKIKLT